MKIIQVWGVYTNSDLTEGRGREVLIGYFHDKIEADKAAKGEGVFGSNADVRATSIYIFDTAKEQKKHTMMGSRDYELYMQLKERFADLED